MPRIGASPSRPDVVVNPRTIRAKYSAGPNLSAISAIAGATNVRPIVLMVPATNDPIAAVASAADARPARAIRCPSSVVIMLPLSPGVFIRMAVVEPPYIAP